jgi:putative heme-binding domain-containing protein
LSGLNDSLRGRRKVDMPKAWPKALASIRKTGDAETAHAALSLAITFGDTTAMDDMRKLVADTKAPIAQRQSALSALLKVRDASLPPTLQKLIADASLRGAALRGLATYDDAGTPAAIIGAYSKFAPAEKRDALSTLGSRLDYAQALLDAVGKKEIAATDLSADLVRQLHNLKNAELDRKITEHWGAVRDTDEDKAKVIADYKRQLTARPKTKPDVHLGRAVFAKTCQQCHTLFAAGGKVGPELTGSNRKELDYVLSNILDSSAQVGKDYQTTVLGTDDGRILTGIVRGEDKDSVTLITATETVIVPKGEIEERTLSPKSMMPDDLWQPLSDHEIRSLVLYLASPEQVAMLGTADNAPTLFNGQNLTGCELVGQTKGLKRNEFLTSDLTVDDFRLSFDVKLVDNKGNSGVQFHSEALPEGEVRGYQADIGAGWWGKLYEENRRGLLWKESGEAHVKLGQWNHYEIVAIGQHVRTWINGKLCVDLEDPNGVTRGVFALQLHSGDATEVRYKNFQLDVNPKKESAAAGR